MSKKCVDKHTHTHTRTQDDYCNPLPMLGLIIVHSQYYCHTIHYYNTIKTNNYNYIQSTCTIKIL